MDSIQRRSAIELERKNSLIKAAALKTNDRLKSLKKLYAKSSDYIHLTHAQRTKLLRELADEIGSWKDARLFAEAVDKTTMSPGADLFDHAHGRIVGIPHYVGAKSCPCEVCAAHRGMAAATE